VTHVKKGIHASKYGVHGEHLSMFVTQRVRDLRQQVQLAIDSVALHGRGRRFGKGPIFEPFHKFIRPFHKIKFKMNKFSINSKSNLTFTIISSFSLVR
jgi:hypothetical protein